MSKRAELAHVGDVVTIDSGVQNIDVTVPEGIDVVIGTESGRVDVRGRLGDVAIVSVSGRVDLDRARTADVRTTSGRIDIGRVETECRAHSISAPVQVEHCGLADVSSKSGRVEVREVDGPALAHSVSGRIDIGVLRAADVEAETVSGRIEVRYPAGVRIHRITADEAGEARPDDTDCVVLARSGTGKVSVTAR